MILETQLASLIDRQSFAKICWDIWRAPQQAPGDPAPPVRLRLNQREKTCFLPVYCRAGLKWHTNRVKLNKYNTPPESQFLSRVQDVDPLTVWVLLTSNQPARDHYRKWKCQHWPLGTNLHNWPKFTFTNAVKNIQHSKGTRLWDVRMTPKDHN